MQGLARIHELCNSPKWGYSSKLRHLLLSLLAARPSDRYSVQDMLEHPWFTEDAALAMHLDTGNGPPMHQRHYLHHQQTVPVPTHEDLALLDTPPANGSSLARRPSPTKVKSFSASSAPAVNGFRLLADAQSCSSMTSLDDPANGMRPHSPMDDSIPPRASSPRHHAPPLTVSSTSKVSLPSLSPEKPVGQRSPEKTFVKRSAHPVDRPTTPKSYD